MVSLNYPSLDLLAYTVLGRIYFKPIRNICIFGRQKWGEYHVFAISTLCVCVCICVCVWFIFLLLLFWHTFVILMKTIHGLFLDFSDFPEWCAFLIVDIPLFLLASYQWRVVKFWVGGCRNDSQCGRFLSNHNSAICSLSA